MYLFTRTEQTLRRHSSNLSIVSYHIHVAYLAMNEFRNAHGRMGNSERDQTINVYDNHLLMYSTKINNTFFNNLHSISTKVCMRVFSAKC